MRRFFVKAYACYYHFLVHWQITRQAEACWPSGRVSDSRARGRGFDPHSGRRVVSLSKIHLPSKKGLVIHRKRWLHRDMTEKIVDCDVKPQPKQTNKKKTCFLPLQSYKKEIIKSLLGYKNQLTIVCGKEQLTLADKSRAIQTCE